MRLIAFYLPQFHEIPENNRWWGEGFTEWTNVRKAKSLFKGHRQPRVPLNDNYYTLDDVNVIAQQAALAKSYGISTFCFYHYWFSGKKLLEKPCEMLLEHPEIDIEYCFSWANEPWTRAWDGETSSILQPQNYGEEEEWEKHYQYLAKFFNDERYVKRDGAPVILICKASQIPHFDRMCNHWNKLARDDGFKNGLFIVETLRSKQTVPCSEKTDAIVEFEPSLSLGRGTGFSFWFINKLRMLFDLGLYKINYKTVVSKSINRKKSYNKKTFFGCFPGWDNTPRRSPRGIAMLGESSKIFGTYLRKQMQKMENDDDYIFINAWNEWAEGAYLEPDTFSKYDNLNEIREAVNWFDKK